MRPTEKSCIDRQRVLIDVARQLSSAQNVEDLLDHILLRSREVMDCEVCSVLLPEESNGDLRIRSTLASTGGAPVLIPKGQGIAGEVFSTKKKINIEDARSDPRHFAAAGEQEGLKTRSLLTIPLLEGDRCLGVMQAINSDQREAFTRDDEEIFEFLGSLVAVTLIRIEASRNAIRQAEAKTQLDLAQEIQRSFLPPGGVRLGSLSLEAFYEPASEIGGDFYFWHELEECQKVLFGVADVSGKGLAAALDMARASTLIASTAHRCARIGISEWMAELNRRLCEVMNAGRFIAVNAIVADQCRRTAQICVAGLPHPMILNNGIWREVVAPRNPPLGISCELSFKQIGLPLAAAQDWLMFTDGILELSDANGDFFEDEAFEASLQRLAKSPSRNRSLLGQLIADWRSFGGGAPNYRDDTTVLSVHDHAEPPSCEFAFTCGPDTVKNARNFVDEWTRFCGFDDRTSGLVVLGCDEVFTNIIKHAYCCKAETDAEKNAQNYGEGPALCKIEANSRALVIQIEHEGEGITSSQMHEILDSPLPSPSETVGGLGIHVIGKIFDNVVVVCETDESRPCLILTKHWD